MRLIAIGTHGLEHIEGRNRVLLEVLLRMLRAESDVGIGRKVKHDITVSHGTRERSRVERVALDEREAGIRNGAGEKPMEAGRKVVESRDVVPVREEPIHEGAADEPGTPGDKCVHADEITYNAPRRVAVSGSQQNVMSTVVSSGELLLRSIVFTQPVRLVDPPSWVPHIPFAFWLIDALRPRTVVELGTHTGVSYSAFAQAVQMLGLDAATYAVDTWKGDHQAGFYDEDVFDEWASFHDHNFSAFSRLVRSTFDEALSKFPDGGVDLLHIDGLHTYEAVRQDFESWLPKLSDRAVVLFHDTNVREADFGVWRFWAEISTRYPSFAFLHGHGLGVLGVGRSLPADVRWLVEQVNSREHFASTTRAFFARLGEALLQQLRDSAKSDELARMAGRLIEIERSANLEAERRVAEAQTQARAEIDRALADSEKRRVEAEAQRRAEAERLVAGVERRVAVAQAQIRSDLEPKIAHAERQLAEMDARRRTEMEQLQLECSRHQSEVTALRRELEVILDSTIWRASAPLRMVAGKLPSSLKTTARTGLQGVYWVLTPWNTPKRLQFLRERYREEHGKVALETLPVDSRTDAPSATVPAIEPDAPPAVTLRLHPVPAAAEPRRPVRADTTATPFAGTIICLSHVFPLPARAGNEYRIHRMLVRLRQSGYRIVLVVSPLSPQAIDDGRWGALAAAYGNVVHCERDGQIRYRMDECPDVLAPLEGHRTPRYAALLDEARPLPPAAARTAAGRPHVLPRCAHRDAHSTAVVAAALRRAGRIRVDDAWPSAARPEPADCHRYARCLFDLSRESRRLRRLRPAGATRGRSPAARTRKGSCRHPTGGGASTWQSGTRSRGGDGRSGLRRGRAQRLAGEACRLLCRIRQPEESARAARFSEIRLA